MFAKTLYERLSDLERQISELDAEISKLIAAQTEEAKLLTTTTTLYPTK